MSNCQEALQKNQRETPLNLEDVRNFRFEAVTHTYARKDTILYALGLGYGLRLRGQPSDRPIDMLRSGASRHVGEKPRARHRLVEDASWRAEF